MLIISCIFVCHVDRLIECKRRHHISIVLLIDFHDSWFIQPYIHCIKMVFYVCSRIIIYTFIHIITITASAVASVASTQQYRFKLCHYMDGVMHSLVPNEKSTLNKTIQTKPIELYKFIIIFHIRVVILKYFTNYR